MKTKVVLITGASCGIGLACIEHLYNQGCRVYGTSRFTPGSGEISPSPKKGPFRLMLPMDVNSTESVNRAVDYILKHEDRLDAVVNNAGIALGGAVEDSGVEEGKALFETNFWGVLRVCQAVLPVMRKQRSGYIINIGSIAGRVSVPFQGLYCASKFALRGMTDAMRIEVKPFGIHVVLIEPGDVQTSVTEHRVKARQAANSPVYKKWFEKALRIIEHREQEGIQANHIARLVLKILKSRNPSFYYTKGLFLQVLARYLKPFLPAWLLDNIIAKFFS